MRYSFIAASLMEWLIRFPALFGAIGIIAGGIVTGIVIYAVQRKYGSNLTGATERLVELQEKQLDTMTATAAMQNEANERTLKMQKEHYEGELNELRKKYTSDFAELKQRCTGVEAALSSKRNELQTTQLEVAELKARPDLTTISEMFAFQGRVMEKVSATLDGVARALSEHDKNLEKRLQAFSQPIKEGMDRVVAAITTIKKLPARD